jgi:hypothetical protein
LAAAFGASLTLGFAGAAAFTGAGLAATGFFFAATGLALAEALFAAVLPAEAFAGAVFGLLRVDIVFPVPLSAAGKRTRSPQHCGAALRPPNH